MAWWTWILVGVGAFAVVYAALVGLLALAGRGEDARAVARFIPDCLVLFRRLLGDPRVPRRRKALIVAMVGYLALPFDLVPDMLPGIGQLDDAILVALVLRALVRGGGETLLAEHWPGPQRSLDVLTALAFGGAPAGRPALLRRGLALEYATLVWNVAGVAVLAVSAIAASSVALAAFGLDSLIEILASAVVVWQLRGAGDPVREPRALRIIAIAFALLAAYIAVQSAITLAGGSHPGRSAAGVAWLGATVVVMLALARGKAVTGRALANPVLRTEARITVVDAALAAAVLAGVALNAALGWWWADPASALVLVVYGARESRHAWAEARGPYPDSNVVSRSRRAAPPT